MALNFDLDDLLAFRAVAELQNFRKAAESINLSQPAFSRRIEKLEDALGVRLLDRTTRSVTLTAVGRDFARKAPPGTVLMEHFQVVAVRPLAPPREV